MYSFKKMIASVIAVGTMATSIASLPAEAGSLITRPDSAFTYDLAVEGTTDGQIKVTFYTTYNPGVSTLGIALKYDSDKLSFSKRVVDLDYAFVLTGNNVADNIEQGLAISITTTQLNSVGQQTDYMEPISISYYFNIKDDSIGTEEYDFSASVYRYRSITENIDFGSSITSVNVDDINETNMGVISKEEYKRKIGDVIPNSIIELEDAIEVLSLIALCKDTEIYPYIEQINTYLTSGFSSKLSNGDMLTWNQRFKDTLYANNVAFAEVADCDQNGLIEQKDADMLMEYYAQQSAALKPESLINTEISKIVYAEITI